MSEIQRIKLGVQIFILLSVGILLFATPATAGEPQEITPPDTCIDPIRFSGTIYNPDGTPFANRCVTIARYNDGDFWYMDILSEAATDNNGFYQTDYAPWDSVFVTNEGHYGLYLRDNCGVGAGGSLIDERDLTYVDFTTDNSIDWDYEWNIGIPEFTTMAMPVIAVIGLMFLFQRRKGK
ncbi:MAG TPA: PEF-CTERM sorting domain-containing protein [archaeon]|nr:PEF-CTERM sorting domain-containing protein [archaeon]